MTRKLHPVTIIPPELYVERSADRQLAEIINSMGRPGYVLVARQMGKTNLLLNARRTLAESDLLFVYVDLSAPFANLSEYYKLILSTAINARPELFQSLTLLRGEYDPAEFQSALLAILRAYPGRIVICLDEIDSLASYTFSDQIFSQIRSMYFAARTNFPNEFPRLTFLLSGVAEPSDLIKNKNVSPFNIGEKIYLTDFTFEEQCSFLDRAKLNLPEAASRRLFVWAGGNPRMTWDICSEIESYLEQSTLISEETIDQIVQDIYLTSFDRPPVDHVRSIVESDREIRDAVRNIVRGNAADVPDEIKTRLYLAGISSMQVGRQAISKPSIKNKVLEQALSEKWLRDIERKSRGLLQLAREHVEENRYEAALPYYEEYLEQGDLDVSSVDAHRVALTFFHTAKYSKAIEWFGKYLSTLDDSEELRSQVSFTLARSYLLQNDIENATIYLRAATAVRSPIFWQAKVGLASVLLQDDRAGNLDEAKRLCDETVESLSGALEGEGAAARANALRNLAVIEIRRGNQSEAVKHLESAIVIGSPAYQPYIIVQAIGLVDPARHAELAAQLLPSAIGLIKLPSSEQPDGGYDEIIFKTLVQLRIEKRLEDFNVLLDEYESAKRLKSSDRYQIWPKLYDVAQRIDPNGELPLGFIKELVDNYETVAAARAEVLGALKASIVLAQRRAFISKYIDLRLSSRGIPFDELDYLAAGYAGLYASQIPRQNYQTTLTTLVSMLLDDVTFRHSLGYCWLCYVEIARQLELGDLQRANRAAEEVLQVIDKLKVPPQLHSQMKQAATEHLNSQRKAGSVVNQFRRFRRNDKVFVRYRDGRVIQEKFKNVERDLLMQNCVLLSEGELLRVK